MQNQNHYAGIDISADSLDVYVLGYEQFRRFPNTKQGRQQLTRWLAGYAPVARIVMEATGGLERACARHLANNGYTVGVLNPSRLAAFRDALGQKAKTDTLDAKVLAVFAQTMPDVPQYNSDDLRTELKDLGARHNQLTQMIAAEKNRQKRVQNPQAGDSIQRVQKTLEDERAELEARIQELIASDDELAECHAILISIPGIGKLNALTMLISMPELGTVNDRQIAALAGVAPMDKQSGKSPGQARLRGGRKHVRQMLYMGAMAAKRYNPKIRAVFERMVAAGKPRKLALAACMRRLICLANILTAKKQKWQHA